jgi:hypothetical protein
MLAYTVLHQRRGLSCRGALSTAKSWPLAAGSSVCPLCRLAVFAAAIRAASRQHLQLLVFVCILAAADRLAVPVGFSQHSCAGTHAHACC